MANSSDCDSGPLQWTTLIIAFISINLTWWIFDVPKLWTRGWRAFLDSVCWQAFRVVFPSVAAVYAVLHAEHPNDIPRVYYLGFDSTREKQRMTNFEYTKVIVGDTLTVVGTIISIYKVCNLPVDGKGNVLRGQWNVAGQVFPTLPVALIGLWLLLVPHFRIKRLRNWNLAVAGGGFLMLSLVCVVFSLILVYLSPLRNNGIYVLPIIGYIVMAFPIQILFNDPRLMLVTSAVILLIRSGQVAIPALRQSDWAPFCHSSQKAFGGVYLGFGILASILAMWGFAAFGRRKTAMPEWRRAKQHQTDSAGQAVTPNNLPESQLADTVTNVQPEVPKSNDRANVEHTPAYHPMTTTSNATTLLSRQPVNDRNHQYTAIADPPSATITDQQVVTQGLMSAQFTESNIPPARWGSSEPVARAYGGRE